MRPPFAAKALACCFLAFAACNTSIDKVVQQFDKPPDIAAFTRAVKVNLPLAYAASIAMDAMNGAPVPGVTVLRAGDSFPCNAVISIPVNRSHPLPVGSDTVTGSMMVVGFWADSATALASVFFTHTDIKDGTFTLRDVAFVPVIHDTSGTMVVFASEDVNADSSVVITTTITDSLFRVKFLGVPDSLPTDSSLAVHQNAWITIAKRPAGASLGSETYRMYGASQYLGVASSTTEVVEAVLVGVKMTPSICRANPDSGFAMVRDIKIQDSNHSSDIDLGTTVLMFKTACTGEATILLATGEYLARTGSTIALNLDK
jgi:hypothetical protein